MGRLRRWAGVRGLLRRLYAEVLPLETFVRRLQERAEGEVPPEPLVQDGDPACYRQLVERCLVGRAPGCKALPARVAFQQISNQSDVVARVIRRLCEKNKKNILTFGYSLMKENTYQLPCMPNIYSYLPNYTTETIRENLLWELILSRVGDDVMMYLLEHCALFMLVPPSCCYQMCGQPIYDLAVRNVTWSPAFSRQRYPRTTHSTLSGYSRRRFRSCGKILATGHWKKGKSRKQKSSKTQKPLDCDYQQTSMSCGFGEMKSIVSQPVTRTSVCRENEQKSDQCQHTSLTTPLRKRKRAGRRHKGAKRVKLTEIKLASEGCAKSHREDELIAVKSVGDTCSEQPSTTQMASGENDCETYGSKSTGNSNSKSVRFIHFERSFLLYCRRQLKECLPKSFVLNRLKSFPLGGRQLVEAIFFDSKILKRPDNTNPVSLDKRKKRLPKRYWQMRGLFQQLLKNHAKCPYLKVLRKNCPVLVSERVQNSTEGESDPPKGHREGESASQSCQDSTLKNFVTPVPEGLNPFPGTLEEELRKSENDELKGKDNEKQTSRDSSSSGLMELLRQHSSHSQVYMFVRECLERVVPADLWGSSHNKRRFYRNVKKFISLGKFARFSLQELLWRMRVKDCVWLRLTKDPGCVVSASEHHILQELMAKFLYWLMDSYVAELLRSFFYITETMFQKNLLFFFRKSVWSQLESIGIGKHLDKVHLRVLSEEEIKALQKKKCVPMASKLRFIPKPNGLRPVVKLKSVVGAETFGKNADKKNQYFNTQLKNLFSVLDYERMKNPALVGSSMFGKDDIYAVWKKFVSKVLESHDALPRFYFVKADVTGAYDTIPHDKLVEVISRALSPGKTTYRFRRYAIIIQTRNGLIRRYYKRHVSTSKEFIPDMKQFVTHLQEGASLRNAVVVEQSVSLTESNSNLKEFFLQFINNSILKITDRYYVQSCGIPQGSILSTLLCNFCYGDMENKLLQGVEKDGILMRLTDDFLLVTPHLPQAKMFLRTLATGIPEYGFIINPAKTMVNFPFDDDIPGCSEFKQLPARCVIPWCGFLIDTQTLEVYCDFSSYACTSIRSSLSFNSTTKAGVSMRNKLLAVLKLKCHSLFIDLQINSLRTVCINIYKILLLQAYRFHACVLQLPFNQKIKNNPNFFLKIISDTASCCFSILKAKNPDISFPPTGTSAVLTYKAVQWLTYRAFRIKLKNHKVIYKCLLAPLIRGEERLIRRFPNTTAQFLTEVTEPSLCEDFKAILD
ncbi:hypothetical protein JRQ81_011687 [Phrynocephalus forsythii]|uniref:Telomerase reverse transcriptase n=1 Tax=Phrynocephalus forsythii TaxID=171643 RepID=A0A9Q0Y0U9_9SAUR|nr:hypothetical protein JRQ81_011687 [Phrynocephalus forsythii]